MKFPLFRRETSKQAQLEAQAQLEKLVADSFRALAQLFAKTAELIDAQRLERTGYGQQDRFLERLDEPTKETPKP
ncbi:MAG TPA: hypothetical protein VE782_03030 [Myxococcaceae bacterium]|nr:hypothetical protein [Myxococcaceae bacterium]